MIFVSTDRSLGTAQGGYTAFITNGAGQVVNVRAPDGTHLTPAAGRSWPSRCIAELETLGYHI